MRRRLALALTLPAVAAMVALSAGAFGAATAGAAPPPVPAWSATQAPAPSDAATGTAAAVYVEATACPSPGFCVAVGGYRTTAGPHAQAPLVEVYAAGSWTVVTVPVPSGAATGTDESASLSSVACSGPTTCSAGGSFTASGGGQYPMIDTMSGTTWTAVQAPLPADHGTGTSLTSWVASVSCPVAGSCTAVGYYEDATGGYPGLIETLAGGAWSATAAPLPSGADTGPPETVTLTSVSCSAAGACMAVGQYHATTKLHGLLVTLSGGSWAATGAPEPAGAGTGTQQRAELASVSCPAIGSCTAVGQYEATTGQSPALVESLSAGTWSAAQAPEPTNAYTGTDRYADLFHVSCPAVGSCVAVGTYHSSTPTAQQQGLIDTLSGGSWTPTQAPLPSNAGATGHDHNVDLYAVTCQTAARCVAAGTYRDATGQTLGLIETWAGGSWAAAQAPEPTNAATGTKAAAELSSVSCVAGGCVAGGSYVNTTGGSSGLLETYNMAPSGYFEAASDGGIFAFTVPFYGSMGGKPLNQPIVASAADTLTGGYYEVASDGGLFAFNAPFLGSMGGKPLNQPIVGMAYDTRTGGYYEVASDGGLFAFTAPFYGSMGGQPLNQPIVGVAFDPSTGGYWEVAADGGLFAFNAPFEGSMGGQPLNQPIVGMAFDSLTGGYYEVATDGGLFAFNAPFEGSMGGQPLNQPVVGMAFDFGTGGYYEVASDGGLFAFDAPFDGSMGGKPLNKPIVTLSVL